MKKRRYWKILSVVAGAVLVLNLIAFSKDFCDWYTDHIYAAPSDLFGRLTALFPIAAGELLLYLGITLVLFSVIFAVLLIFLRGKRRYRRFARGFYKFMLMTVACLLLVITVSWSIPVRGSLLGQDVPAEAEFTYEEIRPIRNALVAALDKAAWEVPRGEDKRIQFPSDEALAESVVRGMQALAAEYPRLTGYYPPYKNALCSDVLEWMGIGGYTFVYTMEISVNQYSMADRLYGPVLFAHESAHHQGYYKESEGDFLSYLGCMRSDDPIVRYAGLIQCCFEINRAYEETLFDAFAAERQDNVTVAEWKAFRASFNDPAIDAIVYADLSGEYEKRQEVYNADAHPLESFEGQAGSIAEVGWNTQAAILQEYNYEGSTALLLQYFSEKMNPA